MDSNTFLHNWQMPSPAELAKRTKASTVMVSLRVKQETKNFFEAQALELSKTEEEEAGEKKNKVTSSSLMNSLLDAYADAYTRAQTEHPLATYLIEDARKLGRMSDVELLYRLYNRYENLNDHEDISIFSHAGVLYYAYTQGEFESVWIEVSGVFLNASKEERASFGADEEFDAVGFEVPARKFPIVANLIVDFRRQQDKLGLWLPPNSVLMNRLVEAINNSKSNEHLAENVARILVEYEESMNE